MSRSLLSLPKAEIHVHLEGCFEPETIVRLAGECGEPLPRAPERLFEFTDISTFLRFLDWTCGLVRTRDQAFAAAYEFCKRLAASGVRYADVIINPTHWEPWTKRLPELIDALDQGFAAAEQDGLPPVKLCISLLRQQSAEESIELVDLLLALKHPRVVALSIDGNETAAGRTGPRFAAAFRKAAEGGLRRTVHAGESSGPDGVWDAIQLLGAERLDHGVRAIEDPKLLEIIQERKIPLGICPSSNVVSRLYKSVAAHPIEHFRKMGIPVSVNTDDPAYLRISLLDEYESCVNAFGWNDAVLREVARTSVAASFADPDTKARLTAEIDAW